MKEIGIPRLTRSRSGARIAVPASDSDVFVPEFRLGRNEGGHEFYALLVLKHVDEDSVASHVVFGALESDVLAHHDAWNLVEHNRSAAHGAGRECRIDCAVPVDCRRQAARVAQAVHLSVIDGTAGLDPAIVSGSDDFSFMNQDRSDGYSAFGKTLPGLFDGCIQEGIFGHVQQSL